MENNQQEEKALRSMTDKEKKLFMEKKETRALKLITDEERKLYGEAKRVDYIKK